MQNSKRKLRDDVWDKMFYLFFEIIGKRKSQKQFEDVLRGCLSPSERIMIGKRVAILYLLTKQIDTITICHVIKVTRTTVAKCALLIDTNPELQMLYKKIIRSEKLGDMFLEIINAVYGPGTYGTSWTEAWKRKKAIEGKKRTGI